MERDLDRRAVAAGATADAGVAVLAAVGALPAPGGVEAETVRE